MKMILVDPNLVRTFFCNIRIYGALSFKIIIFLVGTKLGYLRYLVIGG